MGTLITDMDAFCYVPPDGSWWPDEVAFVFSLSHHDSLTDPHAALAEAIQRVNATTGDWDPKWNSPPTGCRPERSTRGPWAIVTFPEEDVGLMSRWLTALADDLMRHGWQGRLERILEDQRPPRIHPGTEQFTVTVDLGLSGWGSTNMQLPVWRTQPDSVPALVGLAAAWLSSVPGSAWLGNPEWSGGSLPEILRVLGETLADPESRKNPQVVAGVEGKLRRVHFSNTGRVGLVDHQEQPLDVRLDVIRQVLAEWATRVDSAQVAGDFFEDYPNHRVEWGRRAMAAHPPNIYSPGLRGPHLTKVPDACVMQLLTPEHLAHAHDLSEWLIDEVSPKRFIVAHPQPEAWFLPPPTGAAEPGTRVDPGVLAQAREDFGDMLMTPADFGR